MGPMLPPDEAPRADFSPAERCRGGTVSRLVIKHGDRRRCYPADDHWLAAYGPTRFIQLKLPAQKRSASERALDTPNLLDRATFESAGMMTQAH
jgi:hypothetical protein